MPRKCVIKVHGCAECPHFDNAPETFYNEICVKMKKQVPVHGPIPYDCPLPKFLEESDVET